MESKKKVLVQKNCLIDLRSKSDNFCSICLLVSAFMFEQFHSLAVLFFADISGTGEYRIAGEYVITKIPWDFLET